MTDRYAWLKHMGSIFKSTKIWEWEYYVILLENINRSKKIILLKLKFNLWNLIFFGISAKKIEID